MPSLRYHEQSMALTSPESHLMHASMHRTIRFRNNTGLCTAEEKETAVARERLLQTRTMHALNTRDIRTGFCPRRPTHL